MCKTEKDCNMTNYEPVKGKIWDAARAGDKKEFDYQCKAFKEKVFGEWWRIGWGLAPVSIDSLVEMLEDLALKAHDAWLEAMKIGDAPNEDISPGEGFAMCAKLIKEAISNKEGLKHDD